MSFSGWIPPEMLIAVIVIIVLGGGLGYFVAADWIIPFVSHHISIR